MSTDFKLYVEQSVAAQTAFAGLDQAARDRETDRSIASLPGSFGRKEVKGSVYWYYQTKDPDGKPRQIYLGPDNPYIHALMEKRSGSLAKESSAQLSRLTSSSAALGCATISAKHGRVIKRMADYGFFAAGGVLAGTHAFIAYQNHLGAKWRDALMTMDRDFAHPGNNVSLAIQGQIDIDVPSAIESLEMGFLPIHGQARFKKSDEPDFDVDLLTVATRAGDKPIHVASLGVTLQPLKFMELAFERPVQTTLLTPTTPIVVTVPNPAYFAFHKMIVSVERRASMPVKATKDSIQAAALLDHFLDHNPIAIADAYLDTLSRGPGWRRRVDQGLTMITKTHPHLEIASRLQDAVDDEDHAPGNVERPK